MNTYLSLCSEYYELDKPIAPKEALNFYMLFVKETKDPVLEPMCGTGRFLLPILHSGYDIEGFDASPNMLSILQRKAKKMGLNPNVWEQFLENDKCEKKYNLIIIPSSSFGLIIDDKKIDASLKTIYQQLNPGGKFVFEAESATLKQKRSNIWQSDIRQRDENSHIIFNHQRRPIENDIETIFCKYELVEFGSLSKTEIEELKVKKHHPNELIKKIKNVGFTEVNIHKAYQLSKKPGKKDEEIVYECIK